MVQLEIDHKTRDILIAFYCIHSCRSKMLLLVVAVAAIVQGQVAPTITADGESITAEATDLVRFQ